MNYTTIFCYIILSINFAHAADGVIASTQPTRRCLGGRYVGASFIQQCMREHGIGHYFSYFDELSRLPQISDELKITRSMVMIPYFVALSNKTKEEQQRVFEDFTQDRFVLNYPLWRLFLAALWHSGIRDDGFILCTAIENKDTSLVQQLLKQGADVRGTKHRDSALDFCQRVQEVQLLVAYGANIADHHQKNDLIEPICCAQDLYSDKDGIALMEFYLTSGVQLNQKNNFGFRWFRMLLKSLDILDSRHHDVVAAKLKLLWQAGRYSNKSACAIDKFLQKGDCYPMVRKLLQGGPVYRLHERSLTGHHFLKVKPIPMKRTSYA